MNRKLLWLLLQFFVFVGTMGFLRGVAQGLERFDLLPWVGFFRYAGLAVFGVVGFKIVRAERQKLKSPKH